MNEDNKFRFDLWLYNELQKRGMKQIDLANKTGVSPATITYFLQNKRMPNTRTLAVILDALDMHLEIVSN